MLAHEPSAKRGGTGSLYLEINEKRMHNMLLYYNDGARYIRRAPRHKVDKVAAAGFCSLRTWICHPSSRMYPTTRSRRDMGGLDISSSLHLYTTNP